MKSIILFILLVFSSVHSFALHNLKVEITPSSHQITGIDEITFDVAKNQVQFALLETLKLEEIQPAAVVESVLRNGLRIYTVRLSKPTQKISVRYSGTVLDSPLEKGDSQGTIQKEGVALFDGSAWFPTIDGWLTSVQLEVKIPVGWSSVSVGELIQSETQNGWQIDNWVENSPQQGVQLFANQWHKYELEQNGSKAFVYLRTADENLANTYLQTTFTYLKKYEELLGPYPYKRFSLVENFWETGYGMPGFTLLGSQVIRLPFLIQTSYPHEILHNWWGNGVYVDYASGNWSEGLTAYLADHLIASENGQGEEYRRTTLEGFKNFVNDGNDFPLRNFRNRHSEAEQAVGYGKGMMFHHMLRVHLGDALFFKGLQKFYLDFRFKVASFSDLQKTMENVSGQDLSRYFNQWLDEKGAPKIELKNVQLVKNKKWTVSFDLSQNKNYFLKIPVLINGQDGQTVNFLLDLNSNDKRYSFDLDFAPAKLVIDSKYDVFRALFDSEVPPTVSQVLGNPEPMVFVIPRNSSANLFVDAIGKKFANSQVIFDDEFLPVNATRVWVLGWNNKYLPEIQKRTSIYGLIWNAQGIDGVVQAQTSLHSVDIFLGDWNWSAVADETFWARLAAKTPHYGKFSYLVFAGEKNVLKGAWPVKISPLIYNF